MSRSNRKLLEILLITAAFWEAWRLSMRYFYQQYYKIKAKRKRKILDKKLKIYNNHVKTIYLED